jgi:hypothetical protein
VFPGDPERIHWGCDDPAAAAGTTEERQRAFDRVATQLITACASGWRCRALAAGFRSDFAIIRSAAENPPVLTPLRTKSPRLLYEFAWHGSCRSSSMNDE